MVSSRAHRKIVEAFPDSTTWWRPSANHERHEEMLDWIGDYDPQAFSVDKVNRMLAPLGRHRRKTSQS